MHFLQLTVDDYGMDKEIASVTFALFCYFFWQRILPCSPLCVTLFAIDVWKITVESSLPQQYLQPPGFSCLLVSLHARSHAEGHMDIFCTSNITYCWSDCYTASQQKLEKRKRTISRLRHRPSGWWLLIPAAHFHWQVLAGLWASSKVCSE